MIFFTNNSNANAATDKVAPHVQPVAHQINIRHFCVCSELSLINKIFKTMQSRLHCGIACKHQKTRLAFSFWDVRPLAVADAYRALGANLPLIVNPRLPKQLTRNMWFELRDYKITESEGNRILMISAGILGTIYSGYESNANKRG